MVDEPKKPRKRKDALPNRKFRLAKQQLKSPEDLPLGVYELPEASVTSGVPDDQLANLGDELVVIRQEDIDWRREETAKVVGVTCPVEGPLSDYVWAHSLGSGADPTWHLHAALSLFSGLCHAYGFLPPAIGGATSFSVSSMCIGPSGTAKSTAVNDMLAFRSKLGVRVGASGIYLPRAIEFSGTFPGIFEALADCVIEPTGTRAALLYQDEYTTLFNKTKYGWDSQSVCKLADGAPLERHLRSVKVTKPGDVKGVERIERFVAPVVFASTYATHALLLKNQGAGMVLGGMASRFLWATSDETRSTLDRYIHPEDLDQALQSWQELIEWFDAQRLVKCTGQINRIRVAFPEPFQVHFAKSLRAHADSKDTPDHLRQLWKRGLAHGPMLAALFALQCKRLSVHEADVLQAIDLIVRSVAHYDSLYQRSDAADVAAPNRNTALAEKLLRVLQVRKQQGLKRGDLYEVLKRPGKRELEETLDALLEEGRIVEQSRQPSGAGRPTKQYYLANFAPDAKKLRGIPGGKLGEQIAAREAAEAEAAEMPEGTEE